MTTNERILFMRRLALFLRAGISIHTALELVRQDAKRPAFARAISAIAAGILEGKHLSDALMRTPHGFEPLHISLIQVGEASGSLPQHLEQIAVLCVRRRDERQRLLGNAAYPVIILCATIALIAFLLLFAFPKILPLFKGFHAALPLPTRILISITSFVTRYGWLMGLGLVFLAAAYIVAIRFPPVRLIRDRSLIRIPILGSLIRYSYAASITHTLSTLLQSGVGILPALALLARGTRHQLYGIALERMGERIREGRALAETFSEHGNLFPNVVVQLVRAGELTGTLPESLLNTAHIYEQYLEERSRLLGSLVEPALMISMGCIVGFVALAIITPIYGLTQVL